MTTLLDGLVVPKYYTPGYGYSTSSGPPVGGYGDYSPYVYSSTFFDSDVKELLPPQQNCGKKVKKSKKIKKSKKKSKKVKKSKKLY